MRNRNMSTPVVLITGALTGIGRAAAVAFARKGAKVMVAGRRDEAGKALVKELRSLGSEAEVINTDVRKDDDVRCLVDKPIARFARLDVAHPGSPAFRSPSVSSVAFDCPLRAIHEEIVKAGSTSRRHAAASRASASRPRWAKADARQRYGSG